MFQLLIPFYHEQVPHRAKEYFECLHRNVQNALLQKIYLFYENFSGKITPSLTHSKITLLPYYSSQKRTLTFNQMLDFANRNLLGERCIIANSDIFFDKTLSALTDFDFSNTVLAITRHDIYPDTRRNGALLDSMNFSFSQDAWVFQTPTKPLEVQIPIGHQGSDNWIAHEWNRLGVRLLNPAKTIHAWHLHQLRSNKSIPTCKTHPNFNSLFLKTTELPGFAKLPSVGPVVSQPSSKLISRAFRW